MAETGRRDEARGRLSKDLFKKGNILLSVSRQSRKIDVMELSKRAWIQLRSLDAIH